MVITSSLREDPKGPPLYREDLGIGGYTRHNLSDDTPQAEPGEGFWGLQPPPAFELHFLLFV